jgi:hypothetical protein
MAGTAPWKHTPPPPPPPPLLLELELEIEDDDDDEGKGQDWLPQASRFGYCMAPAWSARQKGLLQLPTAARQAAEAAPPPAA